MTLQQRIKASAQELIRLLEESEKEHQDFIKERDARLGIGDPWEPDGHPLELKVIMGKLDKGKPFTRKAILKDPHNPKAEQEERKEISLPYANNAHALSRAISLQIDDVAEQITSKLHAFFEVHGSEAVLQNPTGKIVFNIELSRVDNKLGNKVYHVVETY